METSSFCSAVFFDGAAKRVVFEEKLIFGPKNFPYSLYLTIFLELFYSFI